MANFIRLRGPVTCSGFVRSIGHATMFPCSSSSPEQQLLSSSSWTDLVFGEFGGVSSSFPCVMLSGGALVFVGAGGGGSLLLLSSAVFIACAIALSSVLRCACWRSSVASCFRSSASIFFSFSLRFLMSLVSSFLVFSSSFSSSVIRFPSSSFCSASRLLFLVGFSWSRAWGFCFCSCS